MYPDPELVPELYLESDLGVSADATRVDPGAAGVGAEGFDGGEGVLAGADAFTGVVGC